MLYEVSLLVVKLLVLRAIRVELGEEVYQLILIPEQDVQYCSWFIGIGYKYLKINKFCVFKNGGRKPVISIRVSDTMGLRPVSMEC